jgi:hypothetical protein
MANTIYLPFKQLLLGGDIDLITDTIKVVLIDAADYTVSAAHDFLDDVAAGARVGTPQTLASKTITNGTFDAADVTFPSVTGDPCEAFLLYKDTGNEATSPLIYYADTGHTGLPVTPNGGDINLQFNASGIFTI